MDMDEREVPLQLDFEDDGVEEDEPMADRGAFERQYADERSWEELQEDESGMLRVDVAQQQRQHRKRMSAMAGPRIQRGIIRYLFVLLDFSRSKTVTKLVRRLSSGLRVTSGDRNELL